MDRRRLVDDAWSDEAGQPSLPIPAVVAVAQPGIRQHDAEPRGKLRLARADFGIVGGSTYNSWFTRARAAAVADSVDIDFEVEAWRADAVSLAVALAELSRRFGRPRGRRGRGQGAARGGVAADA